MREVTRDEKWYDEGGRVNPEKESGEPVEQFTAQPGEPVEQFTAELVNTPSETELVTVSLLMRLYDLNLAILATLDEKRADKIYEAHERGEHFNPPVFIPEVGDGN